METDSPPPFPINWLSTQSFSCTAENTINNGDMLEWTIDSISKEHTDDTPHVGASPIQPNKDRTSAQKVLHAVNIFSRKPFLGNKLEILKFMNVDKPQYVHVNELETEFGHFQKVYADSGTTKDQQKVVLFRIKAEDREILKDLTIYIDVKKM